MSQPTTIATKYRWRILTLLFVATTINYMDRSVIGVLGPTLQYKVFHWTDLDYGYINVSFKLAYAVGMLLMGGIIDRFGTRIGYTLSIGIWSIFGMLHAAVRPAFGLIGFILARFGLGFGESGNFPAAIKTVAEWFPKRDRAFATGIFNAGSNVGAILAPTVIPLIVLADGTHWQYAFLITGTFSAIWVVTWLMVYKKPQEHPKVNPQELAYINSDHAKEESKEKISWFKVFPLKETWAFGIGKITDAVWWFYLFWGGKFLYDQFGLDIKKLALPLILVYVIADLGSVAGGYLSGFFMKQGWALNKARKLTLLICALFVMPVSFTTQIKTAFRVDNAFFQKLGKATYTQEKQVTIDGNTQTQKEKRAVPDSVISSLAVLKGKSYPSARAFIREVATVIGQNNTNLMEDPLMNSARSNQLYWIAVLLIAFAAAGHQAWSANLFTLVSDVFPRKATASVTGIGGMVGAAAGILADLALSHALQDSGVKGYFFAFLIAGSMYLIVLFFIHLLMPKMTPLNEDLKHVQG